jgi:hypothetical protein
MNDTDEALREFEADHRRRRGRAMLVFLGICTIVVAIAFVFIIVRERRVVLVGGDERVRGRIEEGPRFIVGPGEWVSFVARPGTRRFVDVVGKGRDGVHVGLNPLDSTTVAPVAQDQCLLVSSIMGLYGAGSSARDIHIVTRGTASREVGIPFSIAPHQLAVGACAVPTRRRLLDDMWLVLSLQCSEMPASDNAARTLIASAIDACPRDLR